MFTVDLCEGKILLKKNMLLEDLQKLFGQYDFSIREQNEVIIYCGECSFDKKTKAIVHLYLNKETNVLESGNIDLFPINFDHIQTSLLKKYGKPTIKNESEYSWEFNDGKVGHRLSDRFGEMEGIYFSFK